jgi:hypothetical protein
MVMGRGKPALIGSPAELRSEYACGYNLSILDGQSDMQQIFAVVQSVIGEANIRSDRPRTIFMPTDLRVADVLERLEGGKVRYTIHLENLEETLRKIIEDEEVQIQHLV